MRWFFRLFVLLLLLVPVGLIALAVMCVDSAPLVDSETRLSAASIDRAKNLLREHDPRKLRADEVKTVSMNEEELNLVVDHMINRLGPGGAVLEMNAGSLAFAASIELSRLAPGRYLNIETLVNGDGESTRLVQLRIGRVSFPPALVQALAAFGLEHLYRASGVHNVQEVIRAVDIQPQRLDVTYRWKAGIADAVRDRIVSSADRQSLSAYNDALAAEVERQGAGLTFATLVEAMFRHARERSAAGGDPVAENRAAIVVLAAYVNGSNLSTLVPEAADWARPKRVKLRIHRRYDFARHFTTSAALAVTGGGAVSNAIGLYKEIDDADGGSGFSFKDLAADKAGTQFGQAAVINAASAGTLQDRLGEGINDAMLIPDVSGLEENLTDAQFKRRYGGVGGAEYERVLIDIDARIAALPLYR